MVVVVTDRVRGSHPAASVHITYPTVVDTLSTLVPREPTMQELVDIGVIDCHVKGKHRIDGWDEFLDRGCRVSNWTSLTLFGLTYAELEANYIMEKRTDLEGRSERGSATNKVPRVEVRDTALLAVQEGDRILEFKNATTCGVLRIDVPPLRAGQRVFVKIGEREADVRFAVECYQRMGALGMPTVEAALTHAIFTLEWLESFARRTDTSEGGKWASAMLRKMRAAAGRSMPVLVVAEFRGERLQHVSKGDARLATATFGQTLLQVLFFSKRVGAKNLGPFNLMVDAVGRVLQVDLNPISSEQHARCNAKGLQTAHRFDARFWSPAI